MHKAAPASPPIPSAGLRPGRRRLSKVERVCIPALLLLFGWLCLQVFVIQAGPTDGGQPVALVTGMDLISHAGAGLPVAAYSNSRQALDAAAARGMTMIEMDFAPTSDGRFVASHDWQWFYVALHPEVSRLPAMLANFFSPDVPSYAQFMRAPMRDDLEPVDLTYLSGWLTRHPAARLITDTKFSNLAFLTRLTRIHGFPLDQVVPQIYGRAQFAPVRKLGFRHIIYTLYRDPFVTTHEVISFARRHDVAITMPLKRAKKPVLEAYRKAGIAVYVHTINDPAVAARLHRWGASGVYTDFLFHPRPAAQSVSRP